MHSYTRICKCRRWPAWPGPRGPGTAAQTRQSPVGAGRRPHPTGAVNPTAAALWASLACRVKALGLGVQGPALGGLAADDHEAGDARGLLRGVARGDPGALLARGVAFPAHDLPALVLH